MSRLLLSLVSTPLAPLQPCMADRAGPSAYRTPLDIIYRVLDAVFAEGIEALFRFALALMKKNEEHLLTLGFDEAVPILATRIFDVYLVRALLAPRDGSADVAPTPQHAPDGDSPARYRVNEFVR